MRRAVYTAWGWRVALTLLLLGLDAGSVNGSRTGQETAVSLAVSATPQVCESKTINYITHTLPQQCLRTAWTSPAPIAESPNSTATAAATGTATSSVNPELTAPHEPQANDYSSDASQEPETAEMEDLSSSTFMSFEEWKEMMLRKSGDPANIKGGRRQQEPREPRADRDAAGITHGDLDSLGDDSEITLDFDALNEKVSEITAASSGEADAQASGTAKEDQVFYDDGKTQYYRSKDAGKTCKERFSYSSFDAGATILKTNPGAKNAKAILVENKDSYMLLECRAKNKFVIVELSDDILVDTVVLANFEFFSSMIRKFRVSVSDRYPVKMDKWVDLGTFEARNSRDIQPFLVEHPQIYTKYIRIEFLTHYGNEYYCPVSLLRVHGTRMLDSWKDPPDGDDVDQIDAPAQEEEIPEIQEPQQPSSKEPEPSGATQENDTDTQRVVESGISPWEEPNIFYNLTLEMCAFRSPTTGDPTPVSSNADRNNSIPAGHSNTSTTAQSSVETVAHETAQPTNTSSLSTTQSQSSVRSQPTSVSSSANSSGSPSSQPTNSNTSNTASQKTLSSVRVESAETPQTPPTAKTGAAKPTNATSTTPRTNKTSAASSAASSPTVQESFFKTVTKRLQHLESNTSLSLQYIEEQSRFLQEVLLTIEKKQISRVDAFLNTLNRTVLTELRNVRTQYDQIWQSTVIALETQREQSQREIVALSTRLNVLAEEVVFQKRMAILQSFLLLSCLVLVIFNRGLVGPSPPPTLSYNNNSSLMSSPSPPPPRRAVDNPSMAHHDLTSSPSPPPLTAASHQQSLSSAGSGARYYNSDKALPLTPTSPDFIAGHSRRQNGGATTPLQPPIIRIDGIDVAVPSPPPPPPAAAAAGTTASLSSSYFDDQHDGATILDQEDSLLLMMTPPRSLSSSSTSNRRREISEEPLVPASAAAAVKVGNTKELEEQDSASPETPPSHSQQPSAIISQRQSDISIPSPLKEEDEEEDEYDAEKGKEAMTGLKAQEKEESDHDQTGSNMQQQQLLSKGLPGGGSSDGGGGGG
ncbi:UNC-like C-terminal-domain-containing protein [Apodospora peruviana]|uniref:UNC-like C-terminal-domain-containing protein n=1 Tax=Apodospora peruviana TaxID=516989 RepID=A0AAE0M7I4_9PEZI|nr:UNC-like C-terminal-domain-containing protein [Apodospora peruviana]